MLRTAEHLVRLSADVLDLHNAESSRLRAVLLFSVDSLFCEWMRLVANLVLCKVHLLRNH